MYVNPFVAGIVATLIVEFVIVVIYALTQDKKR